MAEATHFSGSLQDQYPPSNNNASLTTPAVVRASPNSSSSGQSTRPTTRICQTLVTHLINNKSLKDRQSYPLEKIASIQGVTISRSPTVRPISSKLATVLEKCANSNQPTLWSASCMVSGEENESAEDKLGYLAEVFKDAEVEIHERGEERVIGIELMRPGINETHRRIPEAVNTLPLTHPFHFMLYLSEEQVDDMIVFLCLHRDLTQDDLAPEEVGAFINMINARHKYSYYGDFKFSIVSITDSAARRLDISYNRHERVNIFVGALLNTAKTDDRVRLSLVELATNALDPGQSVPVSSPMYVKYGGPLMETLFKAPVIALSAMNITDVTDEDGREDE